jgi:hypothetical protein
LPALGKIDAQTKKTSSIRMEAYCRRSVKSMKKQQNEAVFSLACQQNNGSRTPPGEETLSFMPARAHPAQDAG